MLDFVGDITVPLSLLVVGSLLAGMSAGQVLRSPKLWLLTAIRLLLLPVALCLVLRALGIDSLVLGIAVTQMAMPVAVNGTLLSMEYGGDTECMAQITFLYHGGVHRDHSHRRRAAALSLERKPICLTFNNWSPT